MRAIKTLFAIGLLAGLVTAAEAQQSPKLPVVTTCGTMPGAYTAGGVGLPTVSTEGVACSSAAGGGGAGDASAANQDELEALIGEVQASPTANTVLDRLKTIATAVGAIPAGGATAANQTTMIGHLDGLEGLVDTLEALIASTNAAVDGIEALIGTTNASLSVLDDYDMTAGADNESNTADQMRVSARMMFWDGSTWDRWTGAAGGGGDASAANQTTEIASIDAVEAAVDGLETLVTATNAAVDGIEALIALTNGYVDGLEALIGTTNTSLSILDDWDETDRAKVNVIVGQAGIAAGTGVDGVTVPRVSLATNVALPAGTNGIGKLTANSGVDIGDVDVLSSALPSGAATNAAVDGLEGSVDGLETAVASTNTKLDTLDTSVDAITTAVGAGTIPTATTLSFLSVNNTTGVNIKASAGTLLHVDCYTTPSATVPLFLKFYNSASAPTCGAGTIVRRIMIPLNTTGGTGVSLMTGGVAGQAYGTGIGYCLTAGVANADTTAPAANVAVCNIDYN